MIRLWLSNVHAHLNPDASPLYHLAIDMYEKVWVWVTRGPIETIFVKKETKVLLKKIALVCLDE